MPPKHHPERPLAATTTPNCLAWLKAVPSQAERTTSTLDLYKAGKRLLDAKEFAKAITAFTDAIGGGHPETALCYNLRGVCFSWLNKHQSALEDADKAVQLRPSATMYCNRGKAFRALKRLSGAHRLGWRPCLHSHIQWHHAELSGSCRGPGGPAKGDPAQAEPQPCQERAQADQRPAVSSAAVGLSFLPSSAVPEVQIARQPLFSNCRRGRSAKAGLAELNGMADTKGGAKARPATAAYRENGRRKGSSDSEKSVADAGPVAGGVVAGAKPEPTVPSRPLSEWSVEEVLGWFKDKFSFAGKYVEAWEDQYISGVLLPFMTDEELKNDVSSQSCFLLHFHGVSCCLLFAESAVRARSQIGMTSSIHRNAVLRTVKALYTVTLSADSNNGEQAPNNVQHCDAAFSVYITFPL